MKEKELTLLILAAGMGSRFGGLKQIEPIGPSGEFIIDYSIYDAIKAGFTKVVFLIKKENYQIFKETIGTRVEGKIKVEYAFQELGILPEGYTCPPEREKPWGTAHAILCAKNLINEPFAIINADDFYGRDAYLKVGEFLKNNETDNYCLIGYKAKNTLTSAGAVKRGVCNLNGEFLTDIIESSIIEENGKIIASPLDGRTPFEIDKETYVSMNMMGFLPSIFEHIEENFPPFLEKNKDNLLKCEYLIPELLETLTKEKKVSTKVIPTTAIWQGITYKEEKENVAKYIKGCVDKGEYTSPLWK